MVELGERLLCSPHHDQRKVPHVRNPLGLKVEHPLVLAEHEKGVRAAGADSGVDPARLLGGGDRRRQQTAVAAGVRQTGV